MRKLVSMVLFLGFMCFSLAALAQTQTVTGKVTDENGEAVAGATVRVPGTQIGAITGIDGDFRLDVPEGTDALMVSFVGKEPRSIALDGDFLDISLLPDTEVLDEVVVTALGIERDKKTLGYGAQEVSGDDLALTNEDNLIGTLAGKIAGVQVLGSAGSAMGGSQAIRLRGISGLTGDTKPLIVIDGVQVSNRNVRLNGYGSKGTGGDPDYPGIDFGDVLSDLNMNDVESVTVLKGLSAAALYGAEGAAGAIIITTKKGESGQSKINVRHSSSMNEVSILPSYQNEYGGGYDQSFDVFNYDPSIHPAEWAVMDGGLMPLYQADESWGPRLDGTPVLQWDAWFAGPSFGQARPWQASPNNVKNFYETGQMHQSDVSFSGGNDFATSRLSLSNHSEKGVFTGSDLRKNTVTTNSTVKFSDNITFDLSGSYANTNGEGRPTSGYDGLGRNVSQNFNQWFQRQLDIDRLKSFQVDENGVPTTWNIRGPGSSAPLTGLYWDNPFFHLTNSPTTDVRDRMFGNAALNFDLADGIKLQTRARMDQYSLELTDRFGTGGLGTDYYYNDKSRNRRNQYDVLLSFNRQYGDFDVLANAGGEVAKINFNSSTESTAGGLAVPNLYNISASSDSPNASNYESLQKSRAAYGNVSVGYRDFLFVEGSLRSDWLSRLDPFENQFTSPGASVALIVSELIDVPEINFLKLRGGFASAPQASSLGTYRTNTLYGVGTPYGSAFTQGVPNQLISDIEPSVQTSTEIGLESRILNDRLGLDINWYREPNKGDIIGVPIAGSSGYSSALVNTGEITNRGWEITLTGTPIKTNDFEWNASANWAANDSEVNSIYTDAGGNDLPTYQLGRAFWGIAYLRSTVGEEAYEMFGRKYERDANGVRVVDPTSGAYQSAGDQSYGSALPDWTGGINNALRYKNFDLAFNFDIQAGGQFLSISKMWNDYSGLSENTVGNNPLGNPLRDPVLDSGGNSVGAVDYASAAPNSGGVEVSGVDASGNQVRMLVDAVTYFGRRFRMSEEYIYDASYFKMRDATLNYNFPSEFFGNTPVKNAKLGLVGRNLFVKSKVDGVDPSSFAPNSSGYSFWEGGVLPSTRIIGLNLNLGF